MKAFMCLMCLIFTCVSAYGQDTSDVNTHQKCINYVESNNVCQENESFDDCKLRICGSNENEFQDDKYTSEDDIRELEKENGYDCHYVHYVGDGQYLCSDQ